MNFAGGLNSRPQSARGHSCVHSDLKARRKRVAFAQSRPDPREAGFQSVYHRGESVAVDGHLAYAARQIAHLDWDEDRWHKQAKKLAGAQREPSTLAPVTSEVRSSGPRS